MARTAMLEAWQKLTPAQRDYDRFVARSIPEGASWIAETKSGQMLKDELLAIDSCSCHISAPCSFCLQSEEQAVSDLKPSDYTAHPMYSVAERIARNIMTILARTGNEWRSLSWEGYCTERQKDGNFSEEERPHFDQVSKYCESAEDANLFFSTGSPALSVTAKGAIELKPSNYTGAPMGSVSKNWESEKIARNIMVILSRTGNEWRPIAWEEYQAERQKDGGFSESEKLYFDRVISYCKSAEDADRFCSSWRT